MSEHERLGPPPIEPLSDLTWSRIERGLWSRMDAAPPVERVARPRRWIWIAAPALAAAAAAAAITIGGGGDRAPDEGPARLVSGAAPTSLSYGDVHVDLDADSAVVMERAQSAVLERGAAWFAVAPRGARPAFVVTAGDTLVRVIGTKFRVARAGEDATVQVEHGTVEVQFRGTTTRVSTDQAWTSRSPTTVAAIRVAQIEPEAEPAAPAEPAPAADPKPAILSERATSGNRTAPTPAAEPSAGRTARLDGAAAKYRRLEQLEVRNPKAAIDGYLALSRGDERVGGARAVRGCAPVRGSQGAARQAPARDLSHAILERRERRRRAQAARSYSGSSPMKIFVCAILAFAVACGGNNNAGGDAGGDGGGGGDGGIDAKVPTGCTGPMLGLPQCSNCIDDDNDGFIDSFDVECTGPLDDNEASFATGIPGDNIDAVNQDCFFDGNSGAGNDGCNVHVCCLLGATTKQECMIGQNQYDPMECPPPIGNTPLSQQCIDVCGALTPPGCDCFGCCTVCNPATNVCKDIATNPNASPNCTLQDLENPTVCKPCTKVTSCGNTMCGGSTCILCPGQDPNDLPPECNGMSECPTGQTSCAMGEACPAQTYCDQGSGCCVGVIL